LDEAASEAGRHKMKLEGHALGQMNFITSPSADTLSQTLNQYGLKPLLAETIPNPMVPASESDLWSLDGCDRKTLLFIGRFDLRKGGDLVLRAFKQLLQADPELKLVFAGPDRGIPDANGRIFHFDDYASTLFSPEQKAHITYLGPVPPARIPSLRKTAMVTLIASRWDNQPNTALEAMMQCCPVVAVDAGGVGEIVAHQSSGLLARNNDLPDFCNQISFMLANPETAAEMGRHARRITAERHAASRLADATLAVYRQALAAAKSEG
jgi:glycosyltransferase involved in cell wall biosynthesis